MPVRVTTLNSVGSTEANGVSQKSKTIAIFAVLVAATFAVFHLCASHLALTFDEGIYLYGAQRLLSGQQLYRDFFLFTGPGTLWLFAGFFKLFGPNFTIAHGILALEIGLITAALHATVARWGTVLAGTASAASFLALLVPFSHRLYINHRWDSCCCVVLALTFLLYTPQKRAFFLISGLFTGTAVLFTPPTLWVCLALILYLLVQPKTRRYMAWFAVAACLPLAIAVAVLASQGALAPMLASFDWAGQHYRIANTVPYGFAAEAPALTQQLSPLQSLLFEIPALLPLLGVLLFAALRLKHVAFSFPADLLLTAGLGMVASLYPRWSTDQLLFAAPLFLALLFLMASIHLRPNLVRIASLAISAFACLVILGALTHLPPTIPVATQLGELACPYRDQPNVEFATSVIQPGDSLFVYPYQPIWYSLTGGVNPTRFNFLQPGMMTPGDESSALRQLIAHPPQWILWHKLSSPMVLAIWPNSDRSTLQFNSIETWIRANYQQVASPNQRYRYEIALFRKRPLN